VIQSVRIFASCPTTPPQSHAQAHTCTHHQMIWANQDRKMCSKLFNFSILGFPHIPGHTHRGCVVQEVIAMTLWHFSESSVSCIAAFLPGDVARLRSHIEGACHKVPQVQSPPKWPLSPARQQEKLKRERKIQPQVAQSAPKCLKGAHMRAHVRAHARACARIGAT